MKYYAVQLLTICMLSWPSRILPAPTTLVINLSLGTWTPLPPGMTWRIPLTPPISGSHVCAYQGVLKLTFSSTRGFAVIKMYFGIPTGYTFNLGDSPTNNGWGRDYGTQRNDAEVHSYYRNIYFYGRQISNTSWYGQVHKELNFVNPVRPVTVLAADGLAIAYNASTFVPVDTHKMFRLRGQFDPSHGGVNKDLYLSFNRVVGTNARIGTGLCKVTVRFYPIYY